MRRVVRAVAILALAVMLPLCVASPAHAMSVAVRIADHSTEVAPSQRVYFDVEIKYPENHTRKDLRVTAQLKQGGQELATAKSLRAIETQTSFLDYIVVPGHAEPGVAELVVTVEDYEGLHQEASATFHVVRGGQLEESFGILFATIVVIGALVIIQVVLLRRRMQKGQK